jgi:nitrogen fixation-related uncharacterized protein
MNRKQKRELTINISTILSVVSLCVVMLGLFNFFYKIKNNYDYLVERKEQLNKIDRIEQDVEFIKENYRIWMKQSEIYKNLDK